MALEGCVVPAAVLLIQAVKHWQATHGPQLPANAKEKQAFRDILSSWQRSIEGVPLEVHLSLALLLTLPFAACCAAVANNMS